MDTQKRKTIAGGLVLILLGIFYLLIQFNVFPGFVFDAGEHWPFFIIGVGVVLFLVGLVTLTPDMMVPACVVGGIGALLLWQNTYNVWESWAYAWTLIPGFSAVGMFLAFLLGGRDRYPLSATIDTLLTSLILFGIFGAAFGAFRGMGEVEKYWPLLLILAGVLILVRGFIRRR
jgi:hypothetical protein